MGVSTEVSGAQGRELSTLSGYQTSFQGGALDSGFHSGFTAWAKARQQGKADVFGKDPAEWGGEWLCFPSGLTCN